MEKYELEDKLKEEIRARVLGEGFMKLVQTVRRNGKLFKIAMRPVEIGGVKKFQAEMTDDGQVQVKNLDANAAAEGLEDIIAQRGARDLHLMTAKGDLHIRMTKKGHAHVSRSAEMDRVVEVKPHDRVKKVPLTEFDSTALLRTIGITDGEGRIRASMRGKYDQVNEFLKVVKETVQGAGCRVQSAGCRVQGAGCRVQGAECRVQGAECRVQSAGCRVQSANNDSTAPSTNHEPPFTVVDCGCGKAYLTISLWYYLSEVLKIPNVQVIGIDRRKDVIEAAKKMAALLDLADKVLFFEADLTTFDLASVDIASKESRATSHEPRNASHVDMVVSLHAYDTATDEALARGVEWKARYILSAPCCQHELQKVLGNGERGKGNVADEFSGLLRQSILRERLCDILTDSFRAMILRILGFKVQVIEFVSSEATARNIMLKCEYGVKPGQPGPVSEYLNLRDYWKVTPWLETRLAKILEKHLARFV